MALTSPIRPDSWTAADIKEKIERKEFFWAHAFVAACARNDIDHRLTKPKRPWINGQVERMNTIKDATVKRFHYETHAELRSHLSDFVNAYNFAKRLKTLKRLTPFELICRAWIKEPERSNLNPLQQHPKPSLQMALATIEQSWILFGALVCKFCELTCSAIEDCPVAGPAAPAVPPLSASNRSASVIADSPGLPVARRLPPRRPLRVLPHRRLPGIQSVGLLHIPWPPLLIDARTRLARRHLRLLPTVW
ncbi:hypothetical protein GGD63_008146 [Bradyrhizobium sp. cir1]|nr:hypothetical protein [Bradyrhizobium sp. cir1]